MRRVAIANSVSGGMNGASYRKFWIFIVACKIALRAVWVFSHLVPKNPGPPLSVAVCT